MLYDDGNHGPQRQIRQLLPYAPPPQEQQATPFLAPGPMRQNSYADYYNGRTGGGRSQSPFNAAYWEQRRMRNYGRMPIAFGGQALGGQGYGGGQTPFGTRLQFSQGGGVAMRQLPPQRSYLPYDPGQYGAPAPFMSRVTY